MCIPNECDTCSNPKFKEISRESRYAGKTLGIFLFVHCILAAMRCISFSFSAALTDIYVVLYGYYISRRYFRQPESEPQAGLCVQCESQQMVMCFMMLLSIDFGLSSWTLVELLSNQPVIPMPVGLAEFDYRTLELWQWYTGIGVAIAVLIVIMGEIVSGWYLNARLNESEIDYRYAKIYQSMENGFGGGGGGGGRGGYGRGGMYGNASYDRVPPVPVVAQRNEGETKSSPSPSFTPSTPTTTTTTSDATPQLSKEEQRIQRENRAQAAIRRQNSGMGTQ